jgi:hypothetical protein
MEPEEVEEIIEEVIEEVVEEIVDEIVPKKKKKNKKNKNKKNKKHHKDETISISNDVDDSYDTKFETTMIENDSSVNTVEEAENLGIFGSILKHLIVSNTWGTAN